MNWDDLRVLLALHRHGSIRGAAEAMGVARSTINRRLEALEASCEATLLERGAEGLALTEAGAAVLPIAERMEDDAHAALRSVSTHDRKLSGRVVLTVFEAASALLAPAFARVHRDNPELELHVVSSPRALRLDRRESDLAIRATHAPNPELFGRRLGLLRYAVYGSADVVSLDNPSWVLPDETMGAAETWVLAKRLADPLRVVCRVDSLNWLVSLLRAGAGVGLLPVVVAREYPELLPWGPVPRASLDMPVWLLTHPDLRRVRRIRMLMRLLAEDAGALLSGS